MLVNRRLAKGVHQPFLQSMHRFQGSMTTLRQIHDKLTPTVAGWPDEIMDEFTAAIEPYSKAQQDALLKLANEAAPLLVRGTLIFRSEEDNGEEDNGEEAEPDAITKAWKMVAEQMNGDMAAAYHVVHLIYKRSTTPELAHTFHRSLLVSAVAALEVLLLELVRNFYLAHPEALGDEATFTLSSLSSFSSIDDARYQAVEEKAHDVLRPGLVGWMKWLKSQKIDLKTHCVNFDQLVEIIQRRHVAVHNDALVSRAYRSKLEELTGLEPPPLGTLLNIDADYFNAALDELEAAGNLLAGAVWTKCHSDAEDIVLYELYVRTYDLMLAGRWVPTGCISKKAEQRMKPEDDLYWVTKANAWLARKRLGEDVSEEVRNWRTAVLGTRFQAVQAALLDDFSNVELLLQRCLQSEELGLEDAGEWPVLEEFREKEAWPKIVSSFSSDD
jgi:hypothetical protein